MTPAETCLAVVEDWLRTMTARPSEHAEDAMAELRARVVCMKREEAHALLPALSRAASLAAAAHSLWEQVAVDCGGPGYAPRN